MSDQDKPITIRGKGWGDGQAVRAANKRRTRPNPLNTYTGFRPRIGENEGAFFVIRDKWCDDPRINKPFSALFNSLLIGIKTACEQTTEIDEHGNVSIELNLGRIIIE